MSALSETITKFFQERVFGHLPSTVVGGIAAVALALADYSKTIDLPFPWNYVVYAVSFVLLAIGAAYKKSVEKPA